MNLAELRQESWSLDTAEQKSVFVDGIEQKKFKAVWNIERVEVASITSNRYNIVQHREVVDCMVKALSNLNLNPEIVLKNEGNRVFVDFTFPSLNVKLSKVGEEFVAGFRVYNSYDKSTGVCISPMLKRLVCSNGMVVSKFVRGFVARHTNHLASNFESKIPMMISNLIGMSDRFEALIEKSIIDSVEWELLDRLMPQMIRVDKHREALMDILAKLNKSNITRWDIYNAFTSYATHSEQLSTHLSNWLQEQAQKILVTPLAHYEPKGEKGGD